MITNGLPACLIKGSLSLQVCMYAPPTDSRSEWVLAVDLRANLLEYCEASGWRVRPVKPKLLAQLCLKDIHVFPASSAPLQQVFMKNHDTGTARRKLRPPSLRLEF